MGVPGRSLDLLRPLAGPQNLHPHPGSARGPVKVICFGTELLPLAASTGARQGGRLLLLGGFFFFFPLELTRCQELQV